MKKPEYPAAAIYDVDDTLLSSHQDPADPLSNLHQIARLDAMHKLASQLGGEYLQLLGVEAQENFDSFALSPVHTVAGAFYTLLKNRGLLTGHVDPTHPIIERLVALKDISYGELLPVYGKPVDGADHFVRDFSTQYGLDDYNAIASTAIIRDIKTFLAMYDLSHLFPDNRIIDIAKVTRPKPDPEAFDTAFRSLDLPEHTRSSVIAVEDDPRGMLSARKSGHYVCGITTRYSRIELGNVEAKPDIIVDSYDELREHFNLPPVK